MIENSQSLSLLRVAEEFTFQYGIGVIPTDRFKRPVVKKVADKRGRVVTREELGDFFSPNGTKKAQWLAALLDSPLPLIALDLDDLGLDVFQTRVLPKCSQGLQTAINSTMRTKTPRNGVHIVLRIKSEDFPRGIHTKEYWNDLGNGHKHNQVNLMGTGYYLVERGPGYKSIKGPECLVTIDKEQVLELLKILQGLKSVTNVIRTVGTKILQYYQQSNRDTLTFALSGYLHKYGVPESLICDLIKYLIDCSGGDEESEKRVRTVRDTCSRDADTDQVSGYSKFLEAVNGDESVILTLQKEFAKLGYRYNGNGNGDARKRAAGDNGKENDDDIKLSTKVIELIRPLIGLLFKNQVDTKAFATIQVNGHREIVQIHKSKRFDLWIRKTYYNETGNTLSGHVLEEVVDILEAEALFGGVEKKLELRVSKDPHDDLVYWYDLGNEKWESIRITKDGWEIAKSNEVPIIFRRYSGQQTQVYPSKDYPVDILNQFIKLINIKKDDSRTTLLLKCYMIAILIPGIAKAALMVHGPQGAAKSAFEDLVKLLLDPSSLNNLTLPRTTEQLSQQLMHNFLTYYDNVSTLPEWLSNDLCRAVTGTASSKRELYSDDDDIIYQYKRPIGFNGINLVATRPDLLDRGLIIEVERIKPENRRSFEEDIKPELERIKPHLLGFILDIIVKVLELKSRGGIKLKSMSRMADFEIACEMISRCLGYEDGEFIKAYEENKALGTSQVLEGSSLARAIIHMMETSDTWSGTATILLSELEEAAVKLKIDIQKDKSWPRAAHILSRRLNEIKANLEELNIFVHTAQDPRTRLKTIVLCKIAFEALEALETPNSRSKKADCANATANATESDHDVAFDKIGQNRAQNHSANATDATNATLQASRGDDQQTDRSLKNVSRFLANLKEVKESGKEGA